MTSTPGDPPPTARALADAAARGLRIRVHARGEIDPADGVVPVKTIVLHQRDGFVFVLVPLAERFSWPRLRAALGVNRVKLPTADEAVEATGYRRGTITPLGASTPYPVVVDRRLLKHRIALGSGSPDHAVVVQADELVAAYAATVVDIAVDGEP